MKTSLFLLLFLISSTTFYAQVEGDAHEIGLMTSLDKSISLLYRKGTSKDLFRMSALLFNSNHNFFITNQQNSHNLNFQLGLGYERRIPVYKRLYTVLGVEGFVGYSGSTAIEKEYVSSQEIEQYNNNNAIRTGVSAIVGLNYAVHDNWLLFMEFSPGLYISYNINHNGTNVDGTNVWDEKHEYVALGYSLNLNSVQLGFAYRFQTPKQKGEKS